MLVGDMIRAERKGCEDFKTCYKRAAPMPFGRVGGGIICHHVNRRKKTSMIAGKELGTHSHMLSGVAHGGNSVDSSSPQTDPNRM